MPSLALWLSFLIGFLSLSEEILWVRTISFAYRSLPPTFSFVLVCYLIGIAAGAALGKRICRVASNLYGVAAILLAAAALDDALMPSFIANRISSDDVHVAQIAVAIVLTAGFKSTLFPLVHHLGSQSEGARVGRSMSRIYFGNILGATLGPLLTGFMALDRLTVDDCFQISAAVCLLASVVCVLRSRRPLLILAALGAAVISSAVAWRPTRPGMDSFGELAVGGPGSITHFIENRHGVIHTVLTPTGEYVYGGNVYDGIATNDVDANPNRLDRVYLVALIHPAPKRLLFIGLSGGAWVSAMEGLRNVESIDVVEINPGYLDLIKDYPKLAPLLADPRLHVHIDDGRRWLRRHADQRFDVVIQNTTYHWRANAGNLLSAEYFSEVKRHLNPGGVMITNTTGSFDVLVTAHVVFPYAYRYANFVYASNEPLVPEISRLQDVLRPDGRPFVIAGAAAGSVAMLLSTARLEPVDEFIQRNSARAAVITDDNLLSEYRNGLRFGPKFLRSLAPPAAPEFQLFAGGQ